MVLLVVMVRRAVTGLRAVTVSVARMSAVPLVVADSRSAAVRGASVLIGTPTTVRATTIRRSLRTSPAETLPGLRVTS